ncbi:hypothetical protein VUR80DRAFT_4094 [Thermomyces stellatus]
MGRGEDRGVHATVTHRVFLFGQDWCDFMSAGASHRGTLFLSELDSPLFSRFPLRVACPLTKTTPPKSLPSLSPSLSRQLTHAGPPLSTGGPWPLVLLPSARSLALGVAALRAEPASAQHKMAKNGNRPPARRYKRPESRAYRPLLVGRVKPYESSRHPERRRPARRPGLP